MSLYKLLNTWELQTAISLAMQDNDCDAARAMSCVMRERQAQFVAMSAAHDLAMATPGKYCWPMSDEVVGSVDCDRPDTLQDRSSNRLTSAL
jgi:hypothetical protein